MKRSQPKSRFPRWYRNSQRNCPICEGIGEIETSTSNDPQDSNPVTCDSCHGYGLQAWEMYSDPLTDLKDARFFRRTQPKRYARIRKLAMKKVTFKWVGIA